MKRSAQINLAQRPTFALAKLTRLPPAQSYILVLLLVDLTLLADHLSGQRIWFGPAYLLVICIATWCLGWTAGQAVGIGCMFATFVINGVELYAGGSGGFVLDLALRFVAISIIIAVIAALRRAYVHEWWLARTDPLTGAFNRQAFFELSAGLAHHGKWRLMIYADLDGLKKVNDIQGHAAGDSALKAYSAVIKRSIRMRDMFARLGGDEFVVFMSVKDEVAARSVAARLHKTMNSVEGVDQEFLRCSVGGLIVPPGEKQIDDLVRHADNLMYQAKVKGASLQIATMPNGFGRVASGRVRRSTTFPYLAENLTARKPLSDRRDRVA